MQITSVLQFRQQIYQLLGQAKDAQFELLSALVTSGRIGSFVELSLSPFHHRQWHSAYAAMERGTLDEVGWRKLAVSQLPKQTCHIFSLDGSIWTHQRARTLEGLVLEPTSDKSHRVPCHLYSSLCWIPEAHQSWALPMSTERVAWVGSEAQTGIAQVVDLCEQKQAHGDASLTVITADGRYGSTPFLQPACELPCVCVVRLRCDRVLYAAPPAYNGFGRPRVHGNLFDFEDPDTWHDPDETQVIEHDRYGQVHLQVWHDLHAKKAPQAWFSVIRAQVHSQCPDKRQARWLAVTHYPHDYNLATIWQWYDYRYSIEPHFGFRKQHLHWTRPKFQQTFACDHWTTLLDIALWMLYLARETIVDNPLPWQPPQSHPTPQRVKLALPIVLAMLPPLTSPPKPRGKSPGWLKGRPRTPPIRHPVNIRSAKITSDA